MTAKINIGDHVEICHDPAFEPTQDSWNEYIGTAGVVVEIDPEGIETRCGVVFDADIAMGYDQDLHWFRCYELIRLQPFGVDR
jgi:hypothetical protein